MNRKKLEQLKRALNDLDRLKTSYNTAFEVFQTNQESTLNKINQAKEEIDELKQQISEEAEKEFNKSGEKKLLGGVGIREGTSISYDAAKALEWAKKHDMCLTLDSKAFEKIAKVQNIDFVEQQKVIQVTFPKEILLD